MPATSKNPLTGFGCIDCHRNLVLNFPPVLRRTQVKNLPGPTQTHVVTMSFNKTRYNQLALHVQHCRLRTNVGCNIFVGTNGCNDMSCYGDRLLGTQCIVNRCDFAISQYQTGRCQIHWRTCFSIFERFFRLPTTHYCQNQRCRHYAGKHSRIWGYRLRHSCNECDCLILHLYLSVWSNARTFSFARMQRKLWGSINVIL